MGGPESDEEGYEGVRQGLEQGRPRRGHRHRDGAEEEGLREGHGQLGCRGHEAGEERGEGDHPWALHDQDAREARDEGGEAGDLRQDGGGQGQAREDRCEGLLRGRPEEEHLSLSLLLGALSCCWLAVPSGSLTGVAPLLVEAMLRSRRGRVYVVVVE